MWVEFSIIAALLTSFLPIINKRLLADTPVTFVSWAINTLSLPLLAIATLVLAPVNAVDAVFVAGVAGSAVLNLGATLVSTQALKLGDASLVTPVLTFNPAFTLLIALVTLGEVPSLVGTGGVSMILLGGYVLNVERLDEGWWKPFAAMVTQPAMLLAVVASVTWGLTPIAEKLAIEHSSPESPPLVALGSSTLMSLLLLPIMLRRARQPLRHLAAHPRSFASAALIAGIAPVFGFSAIGAGLVGYVTAIFKLSTVFSILWAVILLKETPGTARLAGSLLMVVGAILTAV